MRCIALVTLEQIDAIGEHLFEWTDTRFLRKQGRCGQWGWCYKRSVREVTEWAVAQGWPVSYSFVRRIQRDWGAVRGDWEALQESAKKARAEREAIKKRKASRRTPADKQAYHRKYNKKKRAERRAAGLCECSRPLRPGGTRCEGCYSSNRRANAKRRAHEALAKLHLTQVELMRRLNEHGNR